MNVWHAAILGLVEGITEYLPISSTGHLIITSALLGLNHPADVKRSVDAFNVVIQGGAILAVAGLFWGRLLQIIRGMMGRDPVGFQMAWNLAIAFAPAAVLGVLLDDWIESRLFHPGPVMAALAIGGVVMIGLTPWQRRRFGNPDSAGFLELEQLTWRRALVIGLLQCIAMWPGTSRSMMTIVGGMLVGLRPRQAAEFSFLLGLPTLGGACVLKLVKDLNGDGPSMLQTIGVLPVMIGLATATLSAALAVKWLVGFLSQHGVAAFGWYRLALCAVLGILIWRGVVRIAPDELASSPTSTQPAN